jgi:hypothetical protein
MANIIPSGTAEAASADFTLTAGTTTTLSVNDADGFVSPLATAYIQIKSAAGAYCTIGQLDGNNPAQVLNATGTFRVLRLANNAAFGVERD